MRFPGLLLWPGRRRPWGVRYAWQRPAGPRTTEVVWVGQVLPFTGRLPRSPVTIPVLYVAHELIAEFGL